MESQLIKKRKTRKKFNKFQVTLFDNHPHYYSNYHRHLNHYHHLFVSNIIINDIIIIITIIIIINNFLSTISLSTSSSSSLSPFIINILMLLEWRLQFEREKLERWQKLQQVPTMTITYHFDHYSDIIIIIIIL